MSETILYTRALEVLLSDLGHITGDMGKILNLLTPNVNYIGRTAPVTSKVSFYIFIQQI